MGKGYRPQRLGEEIRKIVSDLLVRGALKDPGFRGMVGVSSVDVTNDGSYATLYITALGYGLSEDCSKEDQEKILAAFQRSKGFIRSEIGKKVKIRHIPDLIFQFDSSLQYGLKMDRILDELNIPKDEKEEAE